MSSALFKKLIGGGMFGDRVLFEAEGHTEDMALPKTKEPRRESLPLASEVKYPVIQNGKIIRWESI